jgi:hypothetical protein
MAIQDLSGIGITNFIFFISVSSFFLLFNYWITVSNMSLIVIFCVLTFAIQFGLNIGATTNPLVCGTSNPGVALWFTLIPWLLIVFVGNVFLFSFSGWLRIFANTFGMWISYKALSTDTLRGGPSDTEIPEDKRNNAEYVKIYNEIKQTPQIIINEIDITEMDDDTDENKEKLKKLFESYSKIYPFIFNTNKDDIIKIIKFKNKIGYLIWNILFGLIAVMVSTNSLLNSGCSANII